MNSPENSPGMSDDSELLSRFWSKVEFEDLGCWTWIPPLVGGYGQFNVGRKRYASHRYAWSIFNGPIPKNLLVRHKCDNGSCVRPSHLELGTHADNMRDKVERGRCKNQWHGKCKNGHDLTPDNVYTWKAKPGWRTCKKCTKNRTIDILSLQS